MVFAAGLGTRLKPLTDSIPKALVSYQGRPLLERVLMKLKSSGFTKIVINVHHFPEQIIEFLHSNQDFGMDILFSDEKELLRETGGGVKYAEGVILSQLSGSEYDSFLVHNVDIVSDIDLNWFYAQHNSFNGVERPLATLLVSDRETARYFLFDSENRLVGWTNVITGEVRSPYGTIDPNKYRKLAFSGMHVISTAIFPLMSDFPEKFSIVDFYLSMADRYIIKGVVQPKGVSIVDVGKLNQIK